MSRQTDEQAVLSERLRTFLTDSGWTQGRQARGMSFYLPPPELGVQGKYSVALPDDPTKSGAASLLRGAANALVSVYGYGKVGDLFDQAASTASAGPTRIVSRFVDASTQSGAMSLHALSEFLHQLEKSLYNSAKFKLGGDGNVIRALASQFANECLFLQTKVGSFVASVEVPKTTLRQPGLFDHDVVDSSIVCSSLFSAIDFLNVRVLNDDQPLDTDESLADAVALFDVELLDATAKMITGPKVTTIDFSLESGSSILTSTTGWITKEKSDRLSDYVAFIRKHFREEEDMVVTGSIVELRSRDPESNKNFIRVVANFHGDRTFISASLSNEQYQRAVDAHRTKKPVTLHGNGTRLKTQIRISKLTQFDT
jgi:hypothetical protein